MPNPFVTTGSPPPQQEPANSSQVAVAASITTSTPICEVWPSQSSSQFSSSYPPMMGGTKFHSMSNNESGAGAPPPPPPPQQQQGTNFLHHTPQQHSLARQSSAVKRSIRKAKMQEKRTGEAHRRGVGCKSTGGTRYNKGPPHHLQGLVMTSGGTTNQFQRTSPHGPPSQQAEAAKPHHNATSFAPNSDALLAPPHPPSSAPLFKNLQLGQGAYIFL